MLESAEAKQAVINLLLGAVPERAQDIHDRWKKYAPAVCLVQNSKGIVLNATKDRIAYDAKIMDVFWLIGFSGWKAIECYAPHVLGSATFGGTVAEWMRHDDGLYEVETSYKARKAMVQQLIETANPDSVEWPPDIPRPSANREACDDKQYKVAFDLTLMSLAFAFLHEFEHVIFDRNGTRPSELRDEEIKCDVHAREFMTVKLAAYARAHGHDYLQVLRKRAMGFALAALVLYEITPLWDLGGNQQYFSIGTRLTALLDNTALDDKDHFWNFTACLLVGIHRQRNGYVDAPSLSGNALTRHLIDQI